MSIRTWPVASLLVSMITCGPAGHLRAEDTPGIVLNQDKLADQQAALAKRIADAPRAAMTRTGLAGAMGGVHVRVIADTPQEILLPIPQLVGGQVPLSFFISSTPADAVREYRLKVDENGQAALLVRLANKKHEVRIACSAVVLLSSHDITPNRTPAKPYQLASACVQADAEPVRKMAAATWPASGKARDFAAKLQKHIRESKRLERPRTLDALGILKSGDNSICTANANLAAAAMRARGIACRSIAVLPPISQRLEMHRIVEYYDDGRWVPFDPSSLHPDVPCQPWQNIVMARTTIKDEETAMKPRMGVMVGSPFGQEIELLTPGVLLAGTDFYWTLAKPLTALKPTEETTRRAAKAWSHYLETGTLTPEQIRAGSAGTAVELAERFAKP